MIKKPITLAMLEKRIAYNPSTGDLWWLQDTYHRSCGKAGDSAGSISDQGYGTVVVSRKRLKAHHVAWALYYKVWPIPHHIDHTNGDRSDNRIVNLRPASPAQNGWNKGPLKNNRLRMKGVSKQANANGYFSRIMSNGKLYYLGSYRTPDEAKRAYKEAALRLHGKFARFD